MTEKRKVQVWIYTRDEGQTEGRVPTDLGGLRVLLLKLVDERGGHWQPVTGGVEEGESYPAAALREATEESGLSFVGAPLDLDHEFTFVGRESMTFRERTFGLEARVASRAHSHPASSESPFTPPAITLDPREHVEYQWLSPESARELLRFPSNAEGLSALLQKITRAK